MHIFLFDFFFFAEIFLPQIDIPSPQLYATGFSRMAMLLILLSKVVLFFESVDEITSKCDHLNGSYFSVIFLVL